MQQAHLGSTTNPDTFFNGEVLSKAPLGADSHVVLFSAWNKMLRQATPNAYIYHQSRQGTIKTAKYNHWKDLASSPSPSHIPFMKKYTLRAFFPVGAGACHRGSVCLDFGCFSTLLPPAMAQMLFSWWDPPWAGGIHFPFLCFVLLPCQSPVLSAEK